jgi:hypothetical protein
MQAELICATAVLPPPPPHPDPFLWDWLWNTRCSRLREFRVHPCRHHREYWPCLPGRILEVPLCSWTYTEVTHQLFVSQILAAWFRFQVLRLRDMPLVVIWNACDKNEIFNNHDDQPENGTLVK